MKGSLISFPDGVQEQICWASGVCGETGIFDLKISELEQFRVMVRS